MAFVRPPTTASVFQHLSSCPVTLETGESSGLFVAVVRFQLARPRGFGQEKAIVIAFGAPARNLNKDISSLAWIVTCKLYLGLFLALTVFVFGSSIISLFAQPWNVLVRRYRGIRPKNPVFKLKTESRTCVEGFCNFGLTF